MSGVLQPSYTFPSPYYSGTRYYGRHSVSYSRHDPVSASTLHTSLHLDPAIFHQERMRKPSLELPPASPHRTQLSKWPVRPIRSSVSSVEDVSPWRENDEPAAVARPCMVQQYSDLLRHPDGGIPTQERVVDSCSGIQRVFTGADALEWFPNNMVGVTSVEQAKRVGTQLLKAGLIVNVSGQGGDEFFGSPNALYQFQVIKNESEPETGLEHSSAGTNRAKKTCTVQ